MNDDIRVHETDLVEHDIRFETVLSAIRTAYPKLNQEKESLLWIT